MSELEQNAVTKVADIQPIVPKEFIKKIETTPKSGLYLIEPHAHWIANGYKTAFVKSKKYNINPNEEVYLLSHGLCYGTIKVDEPIEVSIEEFKKLERKHRISERTRQKWCKVYEAWCKGPLYFYVVKVVTRFKPPTPVTLPKGTQNWIDAKNIKFEKIKELPMGVISRLHAHSHFVRDIDLHNLITKEYLDRKMTHPYLDFLDRIQEFLIQNWKAYNALDLIKTTRGRKILLDDHRIVHAWWHLLLKGKRMSSSQFKDYSLEQQKKIIKKLHENITEAFKKLGWTATPLKESDSLSSEVSEIQEDEFSKELVTIINYGEILSKELEIQMDKCPLKLTMEELNAGEKVTSVWIEIDEIDLKLHTLRGKVLLDDGKIQAIWRLTPSSEERINVLIKGNKAVKALKCWISGNDILEITASV